MQATDLANNADAISGQNGRADQLALTCTACGARWPAGWAEHAD